MIDLLDVISKIKNISSVSELEKLSIELLGKCGSVTIALKGLSKLSLEEKKKKGSELNLVKQQIIQEIDNRKQILELLEINNKLESDKIDVTLKKRENFKGTVHPLTQVKEELLQIFSFLGFRLIDEDDSNIEDDFHNFTALNVPLFHPARSMQDTFFIEGGNILRTQTSSIQIREMERCSVPIKIISMGRVYRSDSDATHTPMFHQIEGLWIDKHVTMTHLKNILLKFLEMFFEIDNVPFRFRPSYFPFTEPSAEMDIKCNFVNEELSIEESGDRWLEILGCGMVHPNVLKSVGIDSDEYQGFAFGMGIERLTMLKYGIADMRKYYGFDTKWLNHYGFEWNDIPNIINGLSKK